MQTPGYRLEQYTQQHPQEVLLVKVAFESQIDEILIFKGFSSSLTRPTHFDPDTPVLPEQGVIESIDRLKGPYNPTAPQFLQRNLSWSEMQTLLVAEEL